MMPTRWLSEVRARFGFACDTPRRLAVTSALMDFDLSDDQLALRDAANELLDGFAKPTQVRMFSQGSGMYDVALWDAMVQQGWLGVTFDESLGGLGLSLVELAVLLEALGAHVAPVPFSSTALAGRALLRADRADLVPPLLDGTWIASVAWSKRAGAIRAVPDGDTWRLTGRADPSLYAPTADLVIVPACDHEGQQSLFLVHVASTLRPPREPAMDLTRPLGWWDFADTIAHRLGGTDAVTALTDDGAVFASCEMLGCAQAVLDMSVQYAKDRVQFGRPIGSFQAVKHRCADMLVDVEGMRSTAYWAAWSLGAESQDASIAASTAKCWASDASKRVIASGLQVHGGIGFTWEHDLHFYLKRAQLDQLQFGDAAFHRNRLAQLLRPRVAAGESVV